MLRVLTQFLSLVLLFSFTAVNASNTYTQQSVLVSGSIELSNWQSDALMCTFEEEHRNHDNGANKAVFLTEVEEKEEDDKHRSSKKEIRQDIPTQRKCRQDAIACACAQYSKNLDFYPSGDQSAHHRFLILEVFRL